MPILLRACNARAPAIVVFVVLSTFNGKGFGTVVAVIDRRNSGVRARSDRTARSVTPRAARVAPSTF
jgi:hypothetical protein